MTPEAEAAELRRKLAALECAVDEFVYAYRARYARHSTDGIRSNAPMREQVAKLNAARPPLE